MSYTAIYSPLHPLDTRATDMHWKPRSVTPGAKILDLDGLEAAIPDWDTEMHTHENTLCATYPAQSWRYLEGFKTWDFDRFNIERLAIPSDDAVRFWAEISCYTEPFQFFAAPVDGGWPHVLNIVTASDEHPATYHVTCFDGSVWVQELTARRGSREQVYTGAPATGEGDALGGGR
jgi:hypothetical protein